MRRSLVSVIVAALVTAGAGASVARADGLPVLGVDVGGEGVTATVTDSRFVTIPAGADTIVARTAKTGGRVYASRLLKGGFTIPAVAYDRSAAGLAADARTLVLIQPRLAFPRAETTLLVLDAPSLAPRRLVKLRGDFSFDAISPRGRWVYLIQYLSPNDPTRYRVRAYDVRAGRLAVAPVVDPRESGEKMQGMPLSRATSGDGRWAYTLYSAAMPFIHALDTGGRTARCIDLTALVGTDLSQLRLRNAGATLVVAGPGGPVLNVDRRTFAVSAPAQAEPAAGTGSARVAVAELLAATAGLLLAAAGAALLLRRRRGRLAVAHSPGT